MHERRPIALPAEVLPNFDGEIWPQTDEVPVERSVVQST
jgi:hypothetical protein